MHQLVALMLSAALLGNTAAMAVPATPQKSLPIRQPAMEATIQRYIRTEDFRGTVLVAQGGTVLHRASYGMANDASKLGNELDTRFLIGSLTKSFTAITVLQLVEAGKLDLQAPIGRYIPGLRKELAEQLTLHRLLKHQSGLPVHLERLTTLVEKPVSSADILALINSSERAFAPGSQYEYGNLNYHLAALAIENVTGTSFAEVLHAQTFKPLGMSQSGIERFGQRPVNRANGYRKALLGTAPAENNVSYALGSGDIYSTLDDLYRWDQALAGNTLLKEASKAQLFAGENAELGNYGYGFRIQPYQRSAGQQQAGTLVRHGGSMDGFLSNYHRYLDDQLTVIILANIRPFDIRQLTFDLKEVALGAGALQRKRLPTLE